MSSIEERLARDIAAVTRGVTATESDLRDARDALEDRIDSRRQRDRRRTVVAAAAAAAAAVLIPVLGVTAFQTLGGDDETAPPANPSPSLVEEWTPERTRAEGSRVDYFENAIGPALSGLDAQLYCIGSACDRYEPYYPNLEGRFSALALEVTQDGRSALFDVQGQPWARYFDEDSILVQDGVDQAAVRFRLLQADGTAVQLRLVSDLAPAIPGPDVMLIWDLDVYRSGSIGPDDPHPRPYLVDDRSGTLQPLDVPAEIKGWGPNVDEFLWGGNDGCRAIWQQPDGSFDHYDVDCMDAEENYYSYPEAAPIGAEPGLADWLEPGRMVLVETSDDGIPLVVHASLDRGATWERIEIEDRVWNGTSAQVADALAEVLRELG